MKGSNPWRRQLAAAFCLFCCFIALTHVSADEGSMDGVPPALVSEDGLHGSFMDPEHVKGVHQKKQETGNRDGRGFFRIYNPVIQAAVNPLANLVTFPNTTCNATDGNLGICYKASDCRKLRGVASGTCAHGFGTCCIVRESCRNTTSQHLSYFVNPSFPNPDNTSSVCDYSVDVNNPNVCQIRLDFLDFEIGGPTRGVCDGSKIFINGANVHSDVTELCGTLTGQHIYLNVDPSQGRTYLTLMILTGMAAPGSTVQAHRWNIRITQIDCKRDYKLRAPEGCLQYYTTPNGAFASFNYPANSTYLANLDYAICIRRPPNFCTIRYSTLTPFQLNSDGSGFTGDDCQNDYLMIPQVPDADDPSRTVDRFCGTLFTNSASGSPTIGNYFIGPAKNPIVIRFHSNNDIVFPGTRGFQIAYELRSSCETTTMRRSAPSASIPVVAESLATQFPSTLKIPTNISSSSPSETDDQ